jgi:hypothetical protein
MDPSNFVFISKTHINKREILPFGRIVNSQVLLAFKYCISACMANVYFLASGPSRTSLMEIGVTYCIFATYA